MSRHLTPPVLKHEPVRRVKLYEMVMEKIEGMIHSGEFRPGDELPSERSIMTALNVGRPAVREALLALQGKGLITTENGRRARVMQPSVSNVITTLDGVVTLMLKRADSLKNLFDLRIFIECAMARHAAQVIDDRRLADLKAALEENKRAIGDREAFLRTDVAFHGVLFMTAENPVFDAAHGALVSWLMDRWRKIRRTNETETLAYQGHLHIYQAVSRRDPDAAERAMRRHLEASWKTWAKYLGDS